MDILYYVFAAAALVAGALASIAIWAPRPARCPASAPLRQNRGFAQGRILVSSQ